MRSSLYAKKNFVHKIIYRLTPRTIINVVYPKQPKSSKIRLNESYAEGVDILYQKKAWADHHTSLASIDYLIRSLVEEKDHDKLLTLDNLHGHRTSQYRQKARDNGIFLAYTPEDCTDLCAVNDYGLGQMVKKGMQKLYKSFYLTDPDAWINGTINASMRRILFSKWLAKAWKDIVLEDTGKIIVAFKRCGVFNALDGSEDCQISIKGYNDEYWVEEYEPDASESDAASESSEEEESSELVDEQ